MWKLTGDIKWRERGWYVLFHSSLRTDSGLTAFQVYLWGDRETRQDTIWLCEHIRRRPGKTGSQQKRDAKVMSCAIMSNLIFINWNNALQFFPGRDVSFSRIFNASFNSWILSASNICICCLKKMILFHLTVGCSILKHILCRCSTGHLGRKRSIILLVMCNSLCCSLSIISSCTNNQRSEGGHDTQTWPASLWFNVYSVIHDPGDWLRWGCEAVVKVQIHLRRRQVKSSLYLLQGP